MRAKDVKKPSSDTAQWEHSCWRVRGAKRPRETSEVTAAVRRASGRVGQGDCVRNECLAFEFP